MAEGQRDDARGAVLMALGAKARPHAAAAREKATNTTIEKSRHPNRRESSRDASERDQGGATAIRGEALVMCDGQRPAR